LFQQVAELSKTQHLQRLRCKRAHHDPVVSNIGLALSSLFSSSPSSATAVVRHVAVALCQHLITNYGVADQVCESDSGDEQGLVGWQNTAFAFIQDNLGRNVTVAMIADAVRLSPSHFARLFKAATGVTVHQWLVRRRLERAQDLLHDPSLRLGQIAGICGFCDESHFRKVFVHHLGVTPTDWRRTRLH
jgi:AraC-like DNA-binding protein